MFLDAEIVMLRWVEEISIKKVNYVENAILILKKKIVV
jgi:hypothetical protein|tara:strand:- start:231 stop:344 length:114 start_codon:yes stop_codon:yes gene_type:complete